MCGRFAFDFPADILAAFFGLAEAADLEPRYNITPTQKVPAVRRHVDGKNRLDLLHWGLIPAWAKDRGVAAKMINARCETAAEKPAFRQALRYRRCLVPASGFFEWGQEGRHKQPFFISLKGAEPMALAGLWESWKSPEGETVESCTILTTAANPLVGSIHQRMPVILHPDEHGIWLDREVTDPVRLARLFLPYPADLMELWPVSSLMNAPRHDSAELIAPVQHQAGLF